MISTADQLAIPRPTEIGMVGSSFSADDQYLSVL